MSLPRLQPLLIAGLLPLLVFAWFTPQISGQIDFWLLWLVAMVLVGLPLVFAEVGLAHRSGTTPLVGLPKLTREADVSTVWRGFGWLTALLLLIVTGHLLASASGLLLPTLNGMALPALLGILVLVVIGLSFTKQMAGWLAVGLAVIAIVVNFTQPHTGMAWQMTAVSLPEWTTAVLLALVSVGAGTGLYWHARASQLLSGESEANNCENGSKNASKLIASRQVLPVWGLQMLVGALMAMTVTPTSQLAGSIYAIAMVAGAGYLVNVVTHQLSLFWQQQAFNFLALVIVALVATGFAFLPTAILNQLLVVISLVCALWLAVFSGWQMKISHLRKSLNFGSEGMYNLWRIAVRIVVPLAIILALVGWVMSL